MGYDHPDCVVCYLKTGGSASSDRYRRFCLPCFVKQFGFKPGDKNYLGRVKMTIDDVTCCMCLSETFGLKIPLCLDCIPTEEQQDDVLAEVLAKGSYAIPCAMKDDNTNENDQWLDIMISDPNMQKNLEQGWESLDSEKPVFPETAKEQLYQMVSQVTEDLQYEFDENKLFRQIDKTVKDIATLCNITFTVNPIEHIGLILYNNNMLTRDQIVDTLFSWL